MIAIRRAWSAVRPARSTRPATSAHRVGSGQGTDHLMFETCSSTRGGRLKGKRASAACYAVHRALAGLSQEALAERAGISRRGIADLERGARRFPYPDTASRLAAALELGAAERAAFMAACRPSRTGPTRRYTLQIEPSTFVGRQRELAEISQLVAGSRVLTLTGTGGIGKTRIALELAHQLEAEYADGAAFIDLAPVSRCIARAAGSGGDAWRERQTGRVGDRQPAPTPPGRTRAARAG